MRLLFIYTLLVLSCSFHLNSQVIALFNWNGSDVTKADYGPDAFSINSAATIDQGGVNGTTGLNAGLPKGDIEMLLPGNSFSNITGIDFRIDFQRDENRGDFISSGSNFAFGLDGGELYAKFEKDDTSGGTNIIEVNNIYAVPYDDVFREYRFYYLPESGTARVLVNDSIVWSNTYSSPASLIWENDDVMIGRLMDGNGDNKTIFDNMIIGEVDDTALPVVLNRFEANYQQGEVILNWETQSETNNNYFTIERSIDGEDFSKLAIINGAGTTPHQQKYKYTDKNPVFGVVYYRLRQTDYNGESRVFKIVSVDVRSSSGLRVFPNIVSAGSKIEIIVPDQLTIERIFLMTPAGQRIKDISRPFSGHKFALQSPRQSGSYFVNVITQNGLLSKKLIVR